MSRPWGPRLPRPPGGLIPGGGGPVICPPSHYRGPSAPRAWRRLCDGWGGRIRGVVGCPSWSVTVRHQVVAGWVAAAVAIARARAGSKGPNPAASPGRSARPSSVASEIVNSSSYAWSDSGPPIAPASRPVSERSGHAGVLLSLAGQRDIQRGAAEAEKLQEQARSKTDQAELLIKEMTRLRDRDLADADQRAAAADAARRTIARLAGELGRPVTDAVDADQVVERADDDATEAEVKARAAGQSAEDFARLVAPLTGLRRTGEELNLAYNVLKDMSAALKPGAFPKWLTLRRSPTARTAR